MKKKTTIKTNRAAARKATTAITPTTVTAAAPAPTAPQAMVNPPRYDTNAHFDSGLRYGVADPTLPEPQGAKVKLDLRTRPDSTIGQFSQDHIDATTGNPNFTTPNPSPADFLAGLTAFRAAYSAAELAKAAAKQATAEKDDARAYLDLLLTQRGNYVQNASNGNAAVILSAAFPVKSTPSPVGQLNPPVNLQIHLNGLPGVMLLTWAGVKHARSYVIQCSPADTMAREWSPVKTSSFTKIQIDGLELGKVYAFRIATIGGSTGQSLWSAEVIRMAA